MAKEKSLFIVRHGKSSWDQHGIADVDRPLKERGIRNAYEIAGFLANKGLKPEIIYSSPASRALNTAIIFSRVLKIPENRLFVKNDLYLADVEEILDIVGETSAEINSVMIFGHNPGFTDLVNYLSELRLVNLPTAGLACLNFTDESWGDINRSRLVSSLCEFPNERD